MAEYYIDGSVAGSAGVLNGSGTLSDPWTQNSGVDLLEAARQAILAGPGRGPQGDQVVVLNGGLSLTSPMTVETTWSQPYPFVLRPHVMDGTQRIDFDMGFQPMFATNIIQQGHNFYFCDFHGFGNSTSTGGFMIFNARNWLGYYFCEFDGADAEAGGSTGLIYTGSATHIMGCRFINDSRATGLMVQGSAGCNIRGNYFEINYSASYSMYTYNSEFTHNVLRLTAASSLGAVLPIQGGAFANNTFYGVDAATPQNNGSGIYLPDSYEHNTLINNYFENLRRSVYASTTHQHSIAIFAGNRGYNIFDQASYPTSTSNTTFLTNNDNQMTASGLVDPANGDYRPNSLLIGKGFNLENYWLQSVTTGRKTIGAIEDYLPSQYKPFR